VMRAGPVRADGLVTVVPEWGEPVRHPDAALPGPVSELLALWRQWQGGDSRSAREELERTGYRLTWAAGG